MVGDESHKDKKKPFENDTSPKPKKKTKSYGKKYQFYIRKKIAINFLKKLCSVKN